MFASMHFRRHLIGLSALLAAVLACLPASAQKVEEVSVIGTPDRIAEEGLRSANVGPRLGPARVEGLWCGTGLLHEFSLRLSQDHQEVQGSLARRGRVRAIAGRVDGATVRTQATRHGSLLLELAGDELKVTDGEGALALARGTAFQRASGSACDG
jgi:hypothetical protein